MKQTEQEAKTARHAAVRRRAMFAAALVGSCLSMSVAAWAEEAMFAPPVMQAPQFAQAEPASLKTTPAQVAMRPACATAGSAPGFVPVAFGPHPGVAGPGFQRSLGRSSPLAPFAPGEVSMHAPVWDLYPQSSLVPGGATPSTAKAAPKKPNLPEPQIGVHQHHADCRTAESPYSTGDFAPDPMLGSACLDPCAELGVYGNKRLVPNQRPWVEGFTPLYDTGPWAPSGTCLGPTNPTHPKFYVYGDFRTAYAVNQNIANGQNIWANRLNLDIDFWLTATERFHMFWGPLDKGQLFSGVAFDNGLATVNNGFNLWNPNTDTMFIEGDLGWIVGGARGTGPPYDLPFAVGLIPLVFQNGIWLEDAFVGAAATIPAKNAPVLDWANFDTTVFVGFNQLTSKAFGADSIDATLIGATTFIERRGGYIEIGYAFVADPLDQDRSYHNLGLSYTRRYLNLVSNSMRLIANTGQGGAANQRTADGFLVLMENSFLTSNPYNVVPYVNLFAGFRQPQPLGRLQGPLKNTGINFESDLLTGYPILDDTGNNTYGAAAGVDLLGRQFDRQLIIEGSAVQAHGDPTFRKAAGDQYALGVRWQRRLNYTWLVRADVMHGWLQNANDIDGARVELRKKF